MYWKPLEQPELMTSTLRRWRSALKANYLPKPVETQLDVYGDRFGLTASIVPYVDLRSVDHLFDNVTPLATLR